jgi:hypothetical protein
MRTAIQIAIATLFLAASATPASADEFMRENWGERVGFKPDTSKAPFKTGETVDAGSVGKAAGSLPDGVAMLVSKYGLKFQVGPYVPVAPSDGFIAATNANGGKARLVDTGKKARERGLFEYVAGLPFPQPQNGLEIAWNYQYGYNGDDGDNLFQVYWVSAKNGVERHEDWRWMYIVRAMHRTDVEPIPAIPELAEKEIQYSSLTTALAPFDKKGFTAMYNRFMEPKDQEGWIYIPSQRRATRFSFGTRGDSWNNTDLLYEDVRGYMGYPEWMNWKLKEKKTMYAPVHAGIKISKGAAESAWDFKTAPHWNFKAKWEPRPFYVVEAIPKFADYPYSKMVCYIDAETSYMMFKEAYDKKGQLWKVLVNVYNSSPDPTSQPPQVAGALVVDVQAEHATAFVWQDAKANVGLKPDQFSLTQLRKLGR